VSTFQSNAPFPVGPLRDAGDPLTLMLPAKTVPFARTRDPNPSFGFTYDATGLQVTDWVPGPASWTTAGGADVGAFTVQGLAPDDFTTTPDIVGAPGPVQRPKGTDLTIQFGTAAPMGVRTILTVYWNEVQGNSVTSQTQVACRAPDGATSATIPAAQLAALAVGATVGLSAIRASVTDFTAKGVALGRASFGKEQAGSFQYTP
jgi:hypothetical protein